MYYPLSTVKVSDHFELHLLIAERHSARLLILQHICICAISERFVTFRQGRGRIPSQSPKSHLYRSEL